MSNIVAIVQARMGSERLPEKMMLNLHGYPVIEWVYRRLKRSHKINHIIFALPDTKADEVLEKYLVKLGATVFRGSENNVLTRFYMAARKYKADYVVRICADNPFVSAEEVDRLIDFFLNNKCDYAYNHIPRKNSYPDGLGAEISSYGTLKLLHERAQVQEHREHIFNYIWDNKEQFSILTFDPDNQALAHPELKLDLDTEKDYSSLLKLKVNPDMTANQIVKAAITAWE